MKLIKKKGFHYLLTRLSQADYIYLRDFKKYDRACNINSADKYFSKIISLHLQSLFFMNYAKMLESEGKINSKKLALVIKDLDKLIGKYENVLKTNIVKLKRLDIKRKK